RDAGADVGKVGQHRELAPILDNGAIKLTYLAGRVGEGGGVVGDGQVKEAQLRVVGEGLLEHLIGELEVVLRTRMYLEQLEASHLHVPVDDSEARRGEGEAAGFAVF